MTITEINNLKENEMVGFAGILSTETREGRFVKKVNEYLVEIDYGDHKEQNHIANIYRLTYPTQNINNLDKDNE